MRMHLSMAKDETRRKEMREKIKKFTERMRKLKKETRKRREEIKLQVKEKIRTEQKQKKTLFEKNLYSLIKIQDRQIYEKDKEDYEKGGMVLGAITEEDFQKIQKFRSDSIRMKDVRAFQPRKSRLPSVYYENTISKRAFKKFFLPFMVPYIKENYYIITSQKKEQGDFYKIEGRILEIL